MNNLTREQIAGISISLTILGLARRARKLRKQRDYLAREYVDLAMKADEMNEMGSLQNEALTWLIANLNEGRQWHDPEFISEWNQRATFINMVNRF